jgi:hypothetical protein
MLISLAIMKFGVKNSGVTSSMIVLEDLLVSIFIVLGLFFTCN